MAKATQVTYTVHPNWSARQQMMFHIIQDALPIALAYEAEEIPIMDNHTTEALIDETGLLKSAKKVIEKAEKAHVERLKMRLGDASKKDGYRYKAEYRGSIRTILNQGLCKEMAAAWDEEGIHIGRTLEAIKNGEIVVPDSCILKLTGGENPIDETNTAELHITSDGGRALYVTKMD